MTRAISYLRFSTPEQASGSSLSRQLEKTREYCAKHGLVLDDSDMLRDEGLSAYKADHVSKGALGKFLEKIRTGQIEKGTFLVVERLDRLSRQEPLAAMSLFSEIINHGITLLTLEDGQRYDTDKLRENPMVLFSSLAALIGAHYESKKKSDWVSSAWTAKRKNAASKPLTKVRPAWVDLSADGTFIANPDAKRTINRIFEEAASGIGCYTIARRLQRDGVPTLSGDKRSNGWNKSRVLDIIKTDRVLGWYQPHKREGKKRVPVGEPIKGYYPAVVSPTLANTARAAVNEKSFGGVGSGNKGPSLSNLFAGVAVCGECGGRMHLLHKNRHFGGYLRCWRAFRRVGETGRPVCNNRGTIPYVRLEKAIVRDTGIFLEMQRGMPKSGVAAALEEEIALKQDEAEQLKNSIDNLSRLSGRKGANAPVLVDQIDRLSEEYTGLRESIAKLMRQRNTTHVQASDDWRQIKAQTMSDMHSPLPDVRYKARSQVASVIRVLIKRMVCNGRSVRLIQLDTNISGKAAVFGTGYDFDINDECGAYLDWGQGEVRICSLEDMKASEPLFNKDGNVILNLPVRPG